MSHKPVVYLDIDGVINPFPRMGKMGDWPDYENVVIACCDAPTCPSGVTSREYTLRLSKKMGAALKALEADILWCSTWCDHTEGLQKIADYMGLGTNQLYFLDVGFKLEAVLDDQRENPRPFVWIDDEAIGWYERKSLNEKIDPDIPRLILEPPSRVGVTQEDIGVISQWLLRIRGFVPERAIPTIKRDR